MLLKFVKTLFAAKPAAGTIGPKEEASASLQQGIALQAQGRTGAAEGVFRRLLDEHPDNGDAAHLLGVLLLSSNRCGEAIAVLERAVALKPTQAEAALHLGSAYQSAERLVEAERAFRDALTRSPSLIAAHVSLGILLKQRGQLDAARSAFEAALALQPDSAETWHNLGNLQRDLGDTSGARSSFERALQIAPGFLEARFSRSLALLASGEFETGWPEYEVRLQLQRSAADAPPCDLPEWDGSPTEDAVLVYGEQGIGDEIMFASCLPDLIGRCPRVVLICSGKLRSLFQSSFPAATVLARTSSHDHPAAAGARQMLAIGSLPQHFRRGRADFPQHRGYLRADPSLAQEYRERLAALGSELKVGISWRGGTDKTGRSFRSVSLASLVTSLDLSGVRLVNLQYDSGPDEPALKGLVEAGKIVHWQDALDDYARTAALVSSLDIVVSVCTAAIHLAGALGRPTIVMAPFNPEWRYGREGAHMPWYPSVRIVRQRALHAWADVIGAVRQLMIIEIARHDS